LNIVTIIGARPQFIKAAAVSRHLKAMPKVEEVLVHTGQHYDDNMSAVFFSDLEISPPAYNLGVGSGTHGEQTGRMLEAVERVLLKECPDWLLLYGDTNSTLAASLAAVKLQIPIAHVEGGLRMFNRKNPEEINRLVSDHLSELIFVPTELAAQNLRKEGIEEARIKLVGDVMYDVAMHFAQKAETQSRILATQKLAPGSYILGTVHRAENTDNSGNLRAIFDALCEIAKEVPVVLPLHPRTRLSLQRDGLWEKVTDAVRILEPVGYLDMAMLEKNARLIVSDSGGVPKEGYFYQVPSVILRTVAVWEELVDSGWARTVDPGDSRAIGAAIRRGLEPSGRSHTRLYGDGNAAGLIIDLMLENRQ